MTILSKNDVLDNNMLRPSRSTDGAFITVENDLIPGFFINNCFVPGGLVHNGLIPGRLIYDGFVVPNLFVMNDIYDNLLCMPAISDAIVLNMPEGMLCGRCPRFPFQHGQILAAAVAEAMCFRNVFVIRRPVNDPFLMAHCVVVNDVRHSIMMDDKCLRVVVNGLELFYPIVVGCIKISPAVCTTGDTELFNFSLSS